MKKNIIFLTLLFPIIIKAQQMITLQSAIDSALKNNYDIQIAKNNLEIDKLNNTYGNAGGLPSVNINATNNYSFSNNYYQKFSSGSVTNSNNLNSNNLNAGINAGITLFNGFKVIATKERFSLLQKQGELELNLNVQNTIASIMASYFDIVRQQSYLKIIQSLLDLSKKKLEIVDERRSVGMANDVDYMQSQIDKNTAEQNIKGQELIISQGKENLLQLMSLKKHFPITINDSIIIDNGLNIDSIINYLTNNPQFLSAEMQIKINEQIIKEVAALRYPSIHFNTGYNVTNSNNSAGNTLLTQNYGPFLGFSLLIPIYNGKIYKNQHDIAKYNLSTAKLQKESLYNSITTDAKKTFQAYSNTLQQIDSQIINYELSEKLINLVLDRFRLNQATIIDVKTAQESFENSAYLLINLEYSAKIAEIELKRLIYKLGNN